MALAWKNLAWATNSWLGMNAGPPNAWKAASAGGDHTYVLPDATTCKGQSVGAIEIDDSATYNTTFTSLGGTVQGFAAGTGYTLTTVSQRAAIIFTSDGTNWEITSLVLSETEVVPGISDIVNLPASLNRRGSLLAGAVCATRCVQPYFSQSNGVDTNNTYKTLHRLTENCASIRLVYPNWITNTAAGDIDGANPITVKSSVEYPVGTGNLYFVFFRQGQRSVLVDIGGTLVSDPIDIPGLAGTGFYSYSNVQVSAGETWPLGMLTNSANGEGITVGSDTTDTNTITLATGHAYSPAAIITGASEIIVPSVAIIGDSIVQGKGDQIGFRGYGTGGFDQGYIVRALNDDAGYPIAYVQVAQPAERAISFQGTGHRYRMQIVNGCTYAIYEYGTNDVANGNNLASIQAAAVQIFAELKRMGIPFKIATLIPRTTSTDGWQTASNQTVGTHEGNRTGYNDWAIANYVALGAVGIIDTCALCEVDSSNVLTVNGGFWKCPSSSIQSSTVTSSTGNTLTDSGGAFTSLASFAGMLVYIPSTGDVAVVSTYNATQITFSKIYYSAGGYTTANSTWSTNPAGSAAYVLYDGACADGVHPTTSMAITLKAAVSVTAYRNVVRSSLYTNLSGFWPLDEYGGNRIDTSNNGNDFGGGNVPTRGVGKFSACALFTGASAQYMIASNSTSLTAGTGGAFAVSGWMNFNGNTPASSYALMAKWDSASNATKEWLLRWTNGSGGRFELQICDGTTTTIAFITPSTFSNTAWYFLCGQFDPNGFGAGTPKLRLVVNSQNAFTIAATSGGAQTTTQDVQLGRRLSSGSTADNAGGAGNTCLIDSPGFWKRILTADEVSALYNYGVGVVPPFI